MMTHRLNRAAFMLYILFVSFLFFASEHSFGQGHFLWRLLLCCRPLQIRVSVLPLSPAGFCCQFNECQSRVIDGCFSQQRISINEIERQASLARFFLPDSLLSPRPYIDLFIYVKVHLSPTFQYIRGSFCTLIVT